MKVAEGVTTETFQVGDRIEWIGEPGPERPGERGWLESIDPMDDIVRWDHLGTVAGGYTRGYLIRKVGNRNELDRKKRLAGDPYDEQWDGRDDDLRREFASLPTSTLLGFLEILHEVPEDQETMLDAVVEDLQLMEFSSHAAIRLNVAEDNDSVRGHLINMVEGIVEERAELRSALLTLTSVARGNLRSVLNRDEVDRDAIAAVLPDDAEGRDWPSLVDLLATDPQVRRTVVRLSLAIDAPGVHND